MSKMFDDGGSICFFAKSFFAGNRLTFTIAALCTQFVVSAGNSQIFTLHEKDGKLFSCSIVDSLNRSSCNPHMSRAFLLGKSHIINQSNGFIFLHRHGDRLADPGI